MKKWLIALLLITASPAAYSQGCALCAKTAADMGDDSARGLNGGIVYLAFLPLGIIGTVGYIWWRYNKNSI